MVLIVDTLRTSEEHAENLKNGTSKATFSKHLPRYLRGKPSIVLSDSGKSDAMDIAPYEVYALHGPDKLKWDVSDPVWKVIGEIVESVGLTWGGRWKSPHDPGHMELK
jgi:hypothetical protein